jgi:hypothetical protein
MFVCDKKRVSLRWYYPDQVNGFHLRQLATPGLLKHIICYNSCQGTSVIVT